MKNKTFAVALLSLFIVATSVHAGSMFGTVKEDKGLYYAFDVDYTGQIDITANWKQPHADGFVILVCSVGDLEVMTYSTAVTLRGPAPISVGALGGTVCVLGLATFDKAAAFTASVVSSTGENLELRRTKSLPFGMLEMLRTLGKDPSADVL